VNILYTHRIAIFLALVLTVILIVLHSPWTGYLTEIPGSYTSPMQIEAYCPGYMKSLSLHEQTPEALARFRSLQDCAELYSGHPIELEMQKWTSNAPVIQWFGSIINFAASVVATLILLGGWIFLEKSQRPIETK
jgi:hypothetical protein